MVLQELEKILEIVKIVRTWGSSDVKDLINYLKSGEASIIEKRWNDKFKNDNLDYYPLDLTDRSIWSTYESCYSLDYYLDEGELKCDVIIYEGDSFDGHRKEIRFTATISMNKSFLIKLKPDLNMALEEMANEAYELMLAERKNTWKEGWKQSMLYDGN